jgi:hypothetical protein
VEAVEITDAIFDAPHPNADHVSGVIYDPRERCAFVNNGFIEANSKKNRVPIGSVWWTAGRNAQTSAIGSSANRTDNSPS